MSDEIPLSKFNMTHEEVSAIASLLTTLVATVVATDASEEGGGNAPCPGHSRQSK